MATGLRAELLGGDTTGLPACSMILPDGWIAVTPDDASRRALVGKARQRLAEAHRPDLYGQLQPLVDQAFAQLKRLNAFVLLMAGPGAPDWAFLPASVTGTVVESNERRSLSQVVSHAIAEYGAIPLGHTRQIVRWIRPGTVELQGEQLTTTTLVYMIPVPGTQRSRAIQFTVPIAHPADVTTGDEVIQRWITLFDAHVATFSWNKQ